MHGGIFTQRIFEIPSELRNISVIYITGEGDESLDS